MIQNQGQKLVNQTESTLIPSSMTDHSKSFTCWLGHWLCRQWAASWSLGFGTELLCWSDDADTYGFKAQSYISGAIGCPAPAFGQAQREHDRSSPALKCPWASNPCLDQCLSDRSSERRLGNPHGPCGNLLFQRILIGWLWQFQMPQEPVWDARSLSLILQGERERGCQRYIFFLLLFFYDSTTIPQLHPIQSFFSLSFSLFIHTETVVIGPSLFLPVGKAGVFRDLNIVLRAWSFWHTCTQTSWIHYTPKLCMAFFYALTNSQ